MRYKLFGSYIAVAVLLAWASLHVPWLWLSFVVVVPVLLLGAFDFFQHDNNVRRNFPLFGTINDLMMKQRHVPQELLLQTSWEGRPFSHLQQRLVLKRAGDSLTNEPFGTEKDYHAAGHDWLVHSLYPAADGEYELRVNVGGPDCAQPYSASILNVAAMSFGSISANAVRALCGGAKRENFAVNTGEGGIADHHWEPGSDLIWQIGTAYFGCRTEDGGFDPEAFAEHAKRESVKMIEIKISQGAKPGFGAILPASKNTEEVARYRGIDPHTDVHSPPEHREFSCAEELLDFIHRLRELSGGKPIGIKFCLGQRDEFVELCDTIKKTGRAPDFIAVAGGEGGSGAAHLDSVHHVGGPTEESLVFVHDTRIANGLRDRITLFVAGKVISGFDIVRYLALGADVCYAARGMMFALGCVQSLKCNTDHCPTGITTMDRSRVAGLVVSDKQEKVANYHRNTLEGVRSLLKAAGLDRRTDLRRNHIERRLGPAEIRSLATLYPEVSSSQT